MLILDSTNYRDKPTRTGGTLYDQTDTGLLDGFTKVIYESRVWFTPGHVGDWSYFDASLFAAWAAAQESGVIRLIDVEGLFALCDTRYRVDAAAYFQAHAFWGALRAARAARPFERWMIYGGIYGLSYPWVNEGMSLASRQRAIRKTWGPLDATIAEPTPVGGTVLESAMPYAANDLWTQTVTSQGVRPLDLVDYVLVSCYVGYPIADSTAHPTHPPEIVRHNMAAAARFGKPLVAMFWDRFDDGSGMTRVPSAILREVFFAGMDAAGEDGAAVMWSHSPGHPTAPQSFAGDHGYWRPLWDSARLAAEGTGDANEAVEYHIPAPLSERASAREYAQTIGQPPLELHMRAGTQAGNSRPVTIKVVNQAGRQCTGLFAIRVVVGTDPAGGPGGSQSLSVTTGKRVHEPVAGQVLDLLTAPNAEAVVAVTTQSSGERWLRAFVAGVMDTVELSDGGLSVGATEDDGGFDIIDGGGP